MPASDFDCIYCEHHAVATPGSYCRFCIPLVRIYIEDGLNALANYLSNWAGFRQYENSHTH